MRTIKFRAWNKNTNRMVYTDWNSFRNWYNQSISGKVVYGRGFDGEKIILSEPMQYIGLKDENGIEIYEGDMVEFSGVRSDTVVATVEFFEGRFIFRVNKYMYKDIAGWRNVNIIGNIYEKIEVDYEVVE